MRQSITGAALDGPRLRQSSPLSYPSAHPRSGPDDPHTLRMMIDRPTGDSAVVRVAGAVDDASARDLAALLHPRVVSPGLRVIVLDLSAATFLGAAVLRLLVTVRMRAELAHIALRLVTSPAVGHTLALTGLRRDFTCCPDVASALAAPPPSR